MLTDLSVPHPTVATQAELKANLEYLLQALIRNLSPESLKSLSHHDLAMASEFIAFLRQLEPVVAALPAINMGQVQALKPSDNVKGIFEGRAYALNPILQPVLSAILDQITTASTATPPVHLLDGGFSGFTGGAKRLAATVAIKAMGGSVSGGLEAYVTGQLKDRITDALATIERLRAREARDVAELAALKVQVEEARRAAAAIDAAQAAGGSSPPAAAEPPPKRQSLRG